MSGSTGSCPGVEITDLLASMEEGESDAFSLSASNLVSTNSYSLRVTTDNANTGFDSACTDRQEDVTITSGNTSHTAFLTLYGCTAPGGTVTATLLQGITTVDTYTADVMVTDANVVPVFDPSSYDFSVAEDAATGHVLGTVTATDDDADDTLSYSIASGNIAERLSIDSSTGEITVVNSLDYETAPAIHTGSRGK